MSARIRPADLIIVIADWHQSHTCEDGLESLPTTREVQASCSWRPRFSDVQGRVVILCHRRRSSGDIKWLIRHDVDKAGDNSANCILPSFRKIDRVISSLMSLRMLCVKERTNVRRVAYVRPNRLEPSWNRRIPEHHVDEVEFHQRHKAGYGITTYWITRWSLCLVVIADSNNFVTCVQMTSSKSLRKSTSWSACRS